MCAGDKTSESSSLPGRRSKKISDLFDSLREVISRPPLWLYLCAAIAGTLSWRVIGVALSGKLDENSPAFQWITAVSYAMVAALLVRVLLLPSGESGNFLTIAVRTMAFACALMAWFFLKKSIIWGLIAGALSYTFLSLFFL